MRQTPRLHTLLLIALFILPITVPGQSTGYVQPRSEKLLNGLSVLIWSEAGTGFVTIKLRVHNGAAYDQKGKEGTLALLSDILFPEEGIREFFREDLGGSLEVETTYDYVQITATTRSASFLTALETIAPAVTDTPVDKETTGKVREKRLELLEQLRNESAYESRVEAAERLYGEFPYGRPVDGTPETVANIDFADLIYARERFLTADNATLEITGDVRSDYAYLAARRLFGGWNKSGDDIPATFRLPETPPTDVGTIYVNGESSVRSSTAVEGFARKDPLYHATEVLEKILRRNLGGDGSVSISHEGYLLKGIFYVSMLKRGESELNDVPDARQMLKKALASSIEQADFDRSKAEYLAEFYKIGSDGVRLDADTYKLADAKDEYGKVAGLTLADVRKAAEMLAKRTAVAILMISRPSDAPTQPVDPKDPARK